MNTKHCKHTPGPWKRDGELILVSTLMKLAAKSNLASLRWTVNQLRAHVVRVAGHCRTKHEALEAMNGN
jgi:hypothetical protein